MISGLRKKRDKAEKRVHPDRLEIIAAMYSAWNIPGAYADYGEYGRNQF